MPDLGKLINERPLVLLYSTNIYKLTSLLNIISINLAYYVTNVSE